MHIPDTIYRDALKLRKTVGRLTQECGAEPKYEVIASRLGWDVHKVEWVSLWIRRDTISTETRVGERGQNQLGDLIPDGQTRLPGEPQPDGPDDEALDRILRSTVQELISTLTPKEQKVMILRFGLDDGRAKTLDEVGRHFNVSGERVRQIEARALRKLRHPSRSKQVKDFLG
jgi:RNA polymerase primary sigma factor